MEVAVAPDGGDDGVGGELRTGHARRLEHAELIGREAIQPRLDQGAKTVGNRRAQDLARLAELPTRAVLHHQASIDQVLHERRHEERASLLRWTSSVTSP